MTEKIATVWNRLSEAMGRAVNGLQRWRQAKFVVSFFEAWVWGIGAIARPVQTLQQASDEKPILPALWLTWLQGFSMALGTYYAYKHEGFVASWLIKNLPSWGWVVIYAVFFPPALWFLKAAILNLVAELLGGPPRGLSLLVSTAVACSPLLLVLPIALISVAFAEPNLNTGFVSHLWFVFALGVHAWWVVLTVVAVRETYRFTVAQSILTILLPSAIGLPLAFIIYQVLQKAAS